VTSSGIEPATFWLVAVHQPTAPLHAPDKFEAHVIHDTLMLSRKGGKVVNISVDKKIIYS
jgi:hypothetical protein